ncbi:MAG: hypothetical protein R3B72_04245 [Polyangiaceae bacterium]
MAKRIETRGASYALGRLARALETVEHHPDADVRARAEAKVESWRAVLDGMLRGRLTVGSRTPVADTPAWVTLEVAHGGFATGRFLAEGPLLDHETARLSRLGEDVPGETPRERLNLHAASDEGLSELQRAVRSGRCRVRVPEEGALPVVACLLDANRVSEALELLAELRPLMHRLRFYPEIAGAPQSGQTLVQIAPLDAVTAQLHRVRPQARVAAMRESLGIYLPLYDRLVTIWLATVDGDPPNLRREDDGTLARNADGQPIVVGGWPGRRWPSSWIDDRAQWLLDYQAARREHALTGKHRSPKSNFNVLRHALERCPMDATALGEGGLGRVRHALAGTIGRHGLPFSAEREALRGEQARIAAAPLHADLAHVLAQRLARLDELPDIAAVAGPVTADEHPAAPAGTAIPTRYLRKAKRAVAAPLGELVEEGLITSAEVLASVLPQITSQVAAAGFADPALRDLYAQIYAAFRRRRSLLLLDLESQVSLDDLPWVTALEPLRRRDPDDVEQARQVLEEVVRLTFTAFPHTLIPNPLVTEMQALAKKAELDLALVQEIAADIFMGTFTPKWRRAAEVTRRLLGDTVYARYYDLPQLPPNEPTQRHGRDTDDAFAALCRQRALEAGTDGSWVAQNGAVLEQSQILTTHNVASLAETLDLTRELAFLGPSLARRNLRFILARQGQVAPDYISRLRMLKNTAYAWRQALIFLSFAQAAEQPEGNDIVDEFTADARVALAKQPEPLRNRLWPLLLGLEDIAAGKSFDVHGRSASGGRRFLGWSAGHHWLMPG